MLGRRVEVIITGPMHLIPVMIIAVPACSTDLAFGNGRELSLDFAAIRVFLVLG